MEAISPMFMFKLIRNSFNHSLNCIGNNKNIKILKKTKIFFLSIIILFLCIKFRVIVPECQQYLAI